MRIHLLGKLKPFHPDGPLEIANVQSAKDAARAACAVLGDRFKHVMQTSCFEIFEGNIEDDKFIPSDRVEYKIRGEDIYFMPVIAGSSNVLRIVFGAILIVAGIIVYGMSFGTAAPLGTALIGAGIGMALGGVAGMIVGMPQVGAQNIGQSVSHLFNGPQNQYGQGMPIPVVYGRFRCGSILVNQEIYAQQVVA